jgi:hypothetical protein
MQRPPSTSRQTPVMNSEEGSARKTAAWATSLARPRRPSGIEAVKRARLGVGDGGIDRVRPDALRGEFHRHGLGDQHDGALGAVIPCQARPGAHRGRGTDIDETAAFLSAEDRHAVDGRQVEALHIDRVDAVKLGLADIEHRLVRMADARVVDHDVEPAKAREGRRHQGRHVAGPRDVRGLEDRCVAGRCKVGGGFFAEGDVDVGDHNPGTLRGKLTADFLAEARGAAGDYRHLLVKPHRGPKVRRKANAPAGGHRPAIPRRARGRGRGVV